MVQQKKQRINFIRKELANRKKPRIRKIESGVFLSERGWAALRAAHKREQSVIAIKKQKIRPPSPDIVEYIELSDDEESPRSLANRAAENVRIIIEELDNLDYEPFHQRLAENMRTYVQELEGIGCHDCDALILD